MCTERYDLSTGQRSESTRSRLQMAAGRDRCLFLSIWDHLPRKFERKLRIRPETHTRQRENRRIPSCSSGLPTDTPSSGPSSFPDFLSLSRIFISSSSFPKDLFFFFFSLFPQICFSPLLAIALHLQVPPPSALPSSSSVAATALQSALPADGNSSS